LNAFEDEPSTPDDESALHWDFKNPTGERIQLQYCSLDPLAPWPGNNQPWPGIMIGQIRRGGRRGDESCCRCCTNCGELRTTKPQTV